MTENTFTTTELEALNAAFGDRTWGPSSDEPDARVEVLYDASSSSDSGKFLRRESGDDSWSWWSSATQRYSTIRTWGGIQHFLDVSATSLRLPTAEELSAAGWTIEDEDEETMPLATAALIGARELLEPGGNEILTQSQVNEATALALTSIAATLHDLSVLIEDEYAWRRSQRPVQGTDVEESEPEDSAHRSLGPGEDPGFSFSGR